MKKDAFGNLKWKKLWIGKEHSRKWCCRVKYCIIYRKRKRYLQRMQLNRTVIKRGKEIAVTFMEIILEMDEKG